MKHLMKRFLSIGLLFIFFHAYSQKQDRVWVFQDSLGIDFNNLNSPVVIGSNVNYDAENFACISDTSGQLLFYLSGKNPPNSLLLRLCDRNGNTMLGGDSIFTDGTQTQGSIIFPDPGQQSKYFVVYLQFWEATFGGLPYGLFYSIVDMNQNGGLGKVMVRNQALINHQVFSEKLTAVKHADGRDWWVLTHGIGDNRFYEFLLDPAGFHGPYTQDIGTLVTDTTLYYAIDGQMKFSSDGSRLLYVNGEGICDVFDFDRCSGSLSNPIALGDTNTDHGDAYRFYGCSFSENGQVVYASTYNPASITLEYLYQWDLNAVNIPGSRYIVWQRDNSDCHFSQMALGPDGKIYLVSFLSNVSSNCIHFIHVINSPNSVGASCGLGQDQINVGNSVAGGGLPNIPNLFLGPVAGSVCDSLGTGITGFVAQTPINLYPNPARNRLTIESGGQIPEGSIHIMDLTGREVLSQEAEGEKAMVLNIDGLAPGIYFLHVRSSAGSIVRKFVKE